MSERSKESILSRIRHLLNKTTENGCSENEAALAYRMATRLMAEHQLQMADVQVGASPVDAEWAEAPAWDTARWMIEHNMTYEIIKEFCFVEAYLESYRDSKGSIRKKLMIFGKSENVDNAAFMYQSLIAAYERLWTLYRIPNRAPASDRRCYVVGVAKGFQDKMRDERRALEMERDILSGRSGGTAIVLKRSQDVIKAEMHKRHDNLRARRGSFDSVRGSQSAVEAGYQAGRALNLNRAIGAGGRKAIG